MLVLYMHGAVRYFLFYLYERLSYSVISRQIFYCMQVLNGGGNNGRTPQHLKKDAHQLRLTGVTYARCFSGRDEASKTEI